MVTIVFRKPEDESPPVNVPWERALTLARTVITSVQSRREHAQAELIDAETRRREKANQGWIRRKILRPLRTDEESVREALATPPHGDTLGNDEWLMTEIASSRFESAAERIRTAALIAPAGASSITVRQSDWDDVLLYTNPYR
ncbi:hypothetical protein [Burkholderia cenocepacia]|uniref:hypothetical protein n=1 Tax=Burkholderia cenocepacia TaxID=95486 RepID=UPI00076DBF3C|nr:hypothetical protein [Burkholderia cenocepacia]KWU17793.1 hypothetical protein AS149_13820 [Burkholderia cenocepacia]